MSYAEIKKLQDETAAHIRQIEDEAAQHVEDLYGVSLTWGFLDQEPGLDSIWEDAGRCLQPMIDRLGIYPFVPKEGADYRIFTAQYRVTGGDSPTLEFNFLGGYAIDVILLLAIIGEYSSRVDDVIVVEGGGPAAPVSKPHFKWPEQDQDRLVLTKTAWRRGRGSFADRPGITSQFFNKTVSLGMGSPQKHWWFYVKYDINEMAEPDAMRFPVPGEFIGLAIKLFPGYPWGKVGNTQKSLPFIYTGNWVDGVYYSSARVLEVYDPTDDKPYATYLCQWRKHQVVATPSDFAEYQVDDRVTILKNVNTDKIVQTGSDEDSSNTAYENFSDLTWTLVPVSFYDNGEGLGI